MDFRAAFGFHSMPYTREIPVEHHYRPSFYAAALQALRETVEERQSGALIAPAGTGKSQLLRALIELLPEVRYRVHYVKVTGLSKRDMCREIARAAGLPPAGSYPSLVDKVQSRFAHTFDTEAMRPLLILDEAHELRPDVLGMLRLLTNFDMDSRLVLSVIIAGQPPLAELLRKGELEAVARRLAHYATLRTLSRDETVDYIGHRCTIAGATTVPFDDHAVDAIFEIGSGNLRATDRLALKSLKVAQGKGVTVVDSTHVVHARRMLWP